jgi:hypothetical protein
MTDSKMREYALCRPLVRLIEFLLWTSLVASGAAAQSNTDHESQLLQQVEAMKRQLAITQEQLNAYHTQLENLEQKVVSLQEELATSRSAEQTTATATKLEDAVSKLQEEQAAQQAEIEVHEQAKVETASRFPFKISGLILFNANAIDGAVNDTTLPVFATSRSNGSANGSLSATMSQTILGLEAKGPDIWGAHSYGALQADFFAKQTSSSTYLTPSGILRLRTGDIQLDWPKTTLRAGLLPLILSPTSPNSYLSVAEPAMTWSGNLWAWIPQLTLSRNFPVREQKKFSLEGSLLDVPDPVIDYSSNTTNSSDSSTPTTFNFPHISAGEHSRYPGIALHGSYLWNNAHKNSIGVGAYLSPHSYGEYGHVYAQAITANWFFSLPANLTFSGQFYNGAGLGGLNEGNYKDVVPVTGPNENGVMTTVYHAFRDQGGWTQLGWNASNRLEFNLAFGEDSGNTTELRQSDYSVAYSYLGLVRNQTTLANVIYRPHSSLIFSTEYRKLNSWQIGGGKNQAQIFGLAAGYQF